MVTGFKEIDDKLYFFSRVNGALKTGWQSATEGVWYQNQNGEVVKDWQTIDGKKYYFNEQGIMQKGFLKLNDKIYFFSRVNGALKTGWQSATEGVWYQNQNGEVIKDWQTIEGKKYYFNEQGIMQKGFVKLNDKIYFFSRVNGALKTGWQSSNEGVWYQNQNGEVVKDWQTIEGKKYYFNEQGIMQKGFITLNDKLYFFSRINGALKTGWQSATEGVWYQNQNGEVVKDWQTIEGKKYYFNEQGIMQKGFITLNDKLYFFSRINGALKTGWQSSTEGVWYQNEDGEVLIASGWTVVEGKEYFFENNFAYTGKHEIDGKLYYFDDKTGEKLTRSVKTKYKEIVIDAETGEYVKTQLLPTYYNQKDSRWRNIRYGRSTMGSSGCAPTSIAMAYTSILERQILPIDVAYYLYNETDQFNKRLTGTSGMGVIYASNHFNVNYNGINTKEELIKELKEGKIVFAAMQNGTFATLKWNHAIILYDYNEQNKTTYAYDPLNKLNNKWHQVDLIWREQSQDPDDRLGGYSLYSLYRR